MLLAILFSLIFGVPSADMATTQDSGVELYHVIVTKGEIKVRPAGKSASTTLRRGMKITSKDKIIFTSKESKAIVISSTRGRFLLSASKKASSGSELVAFVNEVVSPLKANSKLSTRGFAESKEVVDFKAFFGDSVFVIIGDTLPFKVGAAKYPMEEKKFLVLRYVYNNRAINKKIGAKGTVASIKRDPHFTLEGKFIGDKISEVDMYYYNQVDKTADKLVSFTPLFLQPKELKAELSEIQSILDESGELSYGEKKQEHFAYVRDVYGWTDMNHLEDFLNSNKILKKK